ncbi:hypothetical protein Sango_1249500 [Sesamum angolense]|uniref:RNase H type-1 domain-containing protein n=1 Tax=Sesamum angolense TaxID=2727404 RepID=A0AAE1WQP2_9LAMI|nr:hypothetical protein Sango_1249500 [Sesamum angolense]
MRNPIPWVYPFNLWVFRRDIEIPFNVSEIVYGTRNYANSGVDIHADFLWIWSYCQSSPGLSLGLSMPYLEVLDLERFGPTLKSWFHSCQSYAQPNSIDGSSLGNPGLAGAAGIIRDSAGHVHLAYQFALGTGTSVLAELTAVWRGMELALTHGLAPFVVEVDATTVISLSKSCDSGKWEVQHLIMHIVRLQQLLVADVQHVFREANGAADHLAKEAASLQLTRVLHHDDITGVLCGILCIDRQGVPHLRQG